MQSEMTIADSQSFYFRFNPEDINVSYKQITCVLGYKNLPPPDQVNYTIEEVLSLYRNLIIPQGIFIIYPLAEGNIKKTVITINDVDLNTGPIISAYLKNSSHAAIFVATIGNSLERLARQLMNEDDYLKGYIMDAVASEAVESVCDLLEEQLALKVKEEEFNITNRYSPGYCNWHVSEQKILFTLLPENPCGISLTESSLMIPVKSVSGIIGAGTKVKRADYNCSFCGIENCYKKKEGV